MSIGAASGSPSRIGYRRILPVIQGMVYLLLVWYGCMYRPTWQSEFRQWLNPEPPVAGGWDPVWIDGPPSVAEQVALGMNAPAVFASLLLLAPFDSLLHNGASKELAAHTLAMFMVPVMWYFIGRKLDRSAPLATRPSIVTKSVTVATMILSSVIAVLIAVSLAVRVTEMLFGRLLILAWAICGISFAVYRIRHWTTKSAAA